jgi:methylenetetrahydrofolate reductase (NADPH)
MRSEYRTRHLLVIGRNPELADMAAKAAEGRMQVDYAAGGNEGLKKVGESRPEIIIIGDLESAEVVSKLCRNLRQGWISRHASLLVVEQDKRILVDVENPMGIGTYPFLPEAAVFATVSREQLISKLKESIAAELRRKENQLKRAMLDPGNFCLIWEQIPGPGAFEKRQEIVLENARRAAESGSVCAISITDNPGGNPAIATDILCAEIRKAGIEPLVHIAFRDKSRNQAESLLFQLAALGINNVLILTGDYPSSVGFTGKSKPVFDLDSVNGLRLVAEMNRGIEREILRKPVRLAATDFFAGVAFSPFKQMEAEVMGQFFKMRKKIAAGADFAITQVGYDARKLHEFQMWLRMQECNIPALASIYVLSFPVARAMHENNIPGCVVTDKLLRKIKAESESGDMGKQARLERAAKMFAIVKGMGYQGAYISGQGLPFESVQYILAKGNELAVQWMEFLPEFGYPQENGFYYFERDAGLNRTATARKTQKHERPLMFLFSRAVHRSLFEPASPLFKPMRRLMQFLDSSPFWYRVFHFFERWSKSALYGCKDCGDCALSDVAYLCPVSQCPKDQRNGPCGGSFQGWCEVYPGKKLCVWVRAYLRLNRRGREEELGKHIVPPCNWELWQTSSWINYFLGRDHSAKRKQIPEP